MINITDKSKCCGCNACVQRCPKQCITMREDEEGFLYPKVDMATCIDCGLCEKVCPVINQNEPRKPLQVFAANNNNEDQRLRSSSGGIFILLAEQTIKQGGVVFGARFDKNWEVEHCYAETLDELEPLMRSKYVQSRIGNTYKEAEQFLKQGRQVLFVGTPCQIAGLRKFLCRDYDNLLAVDFICHGVPSPGVWRKYLEEIKTERSEAAGKNTVLSSSLKTMPEITGINFREKQLGGYGWKKFGFVVHKSPSKGDKNSVLLSTTFPKNDYMRVFLNNYIIRQSCYTCCSKDGKCGSDLTLADFWGVSKVLPSYTDDNKGTSLLICNTQKGYRAIEGFDIDKTAVSIEDACKSNPAWHKSANQPSNRNDFFRMRKEGKTIQNCAEVLFYQPWWQVAQKRTLKIIKAIARRILRMLQLR